MTVQATADTRLGRAVDSLVAAHPARSGIVPLGDGRDAFAARALLAAAADRTLDIEYYIWHADMSGMLLFDAVRQAAERGVRVRLLLDDNNTAGMDSILAALDSHLNIEVRLFNPFTHRRWRYLGYLTDFPRLNRRMHNKSFTADNQVTIIGGRNVGDEYFGAGQKPLFVDLDVLAIGAVVNDVSTDFDRYWASASSYPAESVLPSVSPAASAAVTDSTQHVLRDPAAVEYVQALARQPFVRDLLSGKLDFEWAATTMVSDDPAKGLGRAANGGLLTDRLRQAIGVPTSELELVSPYFVPGSKGVDALAAMAERGVKVSVLTNSLEATDVAAVHAGYAKRRKPLLDAGVKLFEMKREAAGATARDRGLTGSSGSSLHAKTFSVDRSRVFVGSFNFDPRSERLNTEMGFVIDSPELARRIADNFANDIPERSYEVRLSPSGELRWVERSDNGEIVHDVEPGTTFVERAMVAVLSVLPIEWLL
ncbi:MAG TPA: phospholipase D family protein [Gemmatimonadaceae bacterium]|nr:phospholipase D family protein [Gemmatimonadaceae bacterium]